MKRQPPRASLLPPVDLNPRRDPVLDFPDRDLGELGPEDYSSLGFMCGLEVHQQLGTPGKLFCRCPAGRLSARSDGVVLRHMRPTLSEMGEYDGCALMEFKTKKEIVYLLERGSVCTYEIDDTPPFPIDEEAVCASLAIARDFGLQLVSELHVMRKQYLDGSIPAGFQRTAMVGVGGEIPFRGSELGGERVLRIRQLSLEEDSCREVSDVGHRVSFRTDRLGTPLIETVTEPDLLTPLDVRSGARLLAAVARARGPVRRGAGAARQDVNVSIAGSRRVELKGVCHQRGIPLLVHVEAYRQLNLLRIRETLLARSLCPEDLDPGPAEWAWEGRLACEVSGLVARSSNPAARASLEAGGVAACVRLPRFADVLARAIQPGRCFQAELAERVQVIACLEARPCLVSSDLPGELEDSLWKELGAALGADPEDALVCVWGPRDDVDTAAREVLARAAEALVGVPSETRQAREDGSTGFERVLPGPERMYPDTDTPPLAIPEAWVERIEAQPVSSPWRREDEYLRLGLAPALARRLSGSDRASLFDSLAPRSVPCARRLARALEERLVHHRRGGGQSPDAERLRPLVAAIDAGRVRPEALEPALERLLREPSRSPDELLAPFERGSEDEQILARALEALAARRSELCSSDPAARLRFGMGQIMPALLGKLEPALVRRAVARVLNEDEPA